MNATIRIKGYDRIEQIALGQKAVVFKARERSQQRYVVFKVLLPHLMADSRFLVRFKKDVQVVSQLKAENLVNVLLYGRSDDAYFVAYEFYKGVTLDKILLDHRRIPIDVALQIVIGIATGLEACHKEHIIHRNVRPGNIILTHGGGVKLDNLTMATDINGTGRLEFAGGVSASVAYMSPEQTLGDRLGVQTDIYSLGVVTWELLCGGSAFRQAPPATMAKRIQSTTLKRVSEANPMAEPILDDIVQRMLEKDRLRRYSRMSDVTDDLRNAMHELGYHTDAKTMARFVADPLEYTEWNTIQNVKALKEKAAAARTNPIALARIYEKLAHLEPGNEEYRHELKQLKLMAQHPAKKRTAPEPRITDPGMKYRVILVSIDKTRESEESFALKLAMKLQAPLTAVKTYINNMPAVLPGEHIHKKAAFFSKLVEELGAVTRIEPCQSAPKQRRCPECGAEADQDTEYCEFCQHRFIAVVELRAGLDGPETNPWSESKKHRYELNLLRRFLELPIWMKILIVAGLALLFTLVISKI